MLSEAKTPMIEESAEKRGARKREEEAVEGSSTVYTARDLLCQTSSYTQARLPIAQPFSDKNEQGSSGRYVTA